MKKRFLSVVLALCMCMSLLPVAAGASEPEHTNHCVCGGSVTTGNHSCDGSTTWTAWNESASLPSSGSYYLTEDVILSASHTIASGATLNLCLNGHTVTYQNTSSYYEIKGTLNLCDCSTVERTYTSENYKLTGGAVMSSSDGLYLNDSNAALTLYSGNIVGCGETGVYVGKGSFTMYGGEIVGCKDRAVYTTTNGFFTMHGGSIHHNSSNQNSAGVYASTNFTMTGGSITNNNSSSSSGYVGGVYFNSSLTLSGAPVIKDNTINGNAGNLYLYKKVTIGTNGLTDGASIGVTAPTSYSGPREADITNSNDADYSSYFFPDDPGTYHIENTGEGSSQVVKLALGAASPSHEHNWTYTVADKNEDGDPETIVATCTGTSGTCEATNKELTIIAPLHEQVNDGKTPEATFANNATSVGGEDTLPAIMYQQTATSYPYDPIGAPTATPPTGAGRFEASITVEGAKASVVYIIKKLDRENIKPFTVSDITNNSFVITLDEADRGKTDFVCEIASDYIEFTPDENGKATITVPEAYAGHGNLWVYVYQKETDTHKKSNTKDATVSLLPATPTPAETPVIGTDLSTTEVTYDKDAAATALSTTASITDGGTLSYQWYKNDAASTDGAQAIDGETGASYTPATSAAGTTYYYCVITNTKDDQTATAISAIAKITVNDPAPTTYTVTYDANGGNGTVVDDTEYESGDAVTLKSGSGLTKSGYTFSGWNTAANGSGAAYSASDTYTITADTIFYAQWTQNEGEKDAAVDNTAAGSYAGTMVSGWGDLATKDENGNAYAANVPVEVKLTVTAKTENTAPPAEVTAIKNTASGKTLQFLDLTLSRKVGSGPIEDIGDNNTQLLTIVIPFQKGNKQNITVYRYHGTQAEALTENPPADAEGFVVGSDSITIYAKKFSTYAIGYTVPAVNPPSSSGNYTPTYTITVEKTDNGEVKVNRSYASRGSTVTITATPEDGYELSALTVTDSQGNKIELAEKGDGTYTFKMPGRKVTVMAAFIPDGSYSTCTGDSSCPMCGYTDLDTKAWYHDGVHYCIDNGLMVGYGADIFKPNADTTRAMITVMLWRLKGSPVVNYLLDFEDVEEGKWYTEAIRWAKSEGIAAGYGNGYFGTNDAVTREQMVTILWRYAQHMGIDVSVGEDTNILSYNDAFELAEYAIPAMQWACGSGMVQGMNDPDGEGMVLAPESKGTRAQIAVIFQRYCLYTEK